MKELFFGILLLCVSIPAFADQVLVTDAKITSIRMYGRTFDTQAVILWVDKLPEECQALWMPTGSSQGERAYSLILSSFEKSLTNEMLIETGSNIPNYAGKGNACEILYLHVSKP